MAAPEHGIRIAELVRRTGTPKETIHYYLRVGLLRKPKKTSKNMAYYDDRHVEELKLIRRLRTESYLPLSVIKKIIKEDRLSESAKKADLAGEIFGLGAKTEFEPLSRKGLAKKSGLSEAMIDKAEAAGLLRPPEIKGKKRYRWEDVRAAGIIASALEEAGDDGQAYVFERFAILERHIEAMVRDEGAHFFGRVMAGGDANRAVELLRGGRETIGRYMAVARVRRLRDDFETIFRELESGMTATPVPDHWRLSDPVRDAHGIEAELDRRERAFKDSGLEAHAHAYLSLLLLDGQTALALRRFRKLAAPMREAPDIALVAVEAMIELVQYDEARALIEPIRNARPDMLNEALYATSVLGGLVQSFGAPGSSSANFGLLASAFMASSDLLGSLTQGISAMLGAQAAPAASSFEGLRARLLLGRAQSWTPTFLGLRGTAWRQLHECMDLARSLHRTPDDPGFGVLERLELNAAMYAIRIARTEADKLPLIERARAIDPDVEL